MPRSTRRLLLPVLAAGLVLAGLTAWLARDPALAWYQLRGLAAAGPEDRAVRAEAVAARGPAAWPALFDLLRRDQPQACENAAAALAVQIRDWPADDPRACDLARRLADAFPRLSIPGRQNVMALSAAWLRTAEPAAPASETARALARLVPEAARLDDGDLRGSALDLAAALLSRPEAPEWVSPCRDLARATLQDPDPDRRTRAVQLALYPGMDLSRQLVPLLRDSLPEVRRMAILALGPDQEVLVTEDLLRWLHDPDPEVRRLTDMALRGRKLPDNHIRLGRLLTDDRPEVRLEVLDHLRRAGDLDPGVWLRHLSHDPVPSVRAAAMRASTADYARVPFADRLEQMQADPSPTVRQLAQHFLPVKRRLEADDSPRDRIE